MKVEEVTKPDRVFTISLTGDDLEILTRQFVYGGVDWDNIPAIHELIDKLTDLQ